MAIIKFNVGDVLKLKKNHPCGSDEFKVLKCGSDIKIACTGCKRDITIPRINLEKMIKKVFEAKTEGLDV